MLKQLVTEVDRYLMKFLSYSAFLKPNIPWRQFEMFGSVTVNIFECIEKIVGNASVLLSK